MSFGKRLQSERKRLGLTQPAFAELGGIKRVSQHLYEQDVRVPDVRYLLNLISHGVDTGFLLTGQRSGGSSEEHVISRHRALMAFRAVEDFCQRRQDDPMPYKERERLFESLCGTLADDEHDDLDVSTANQPRVVG